MSKTMAAIYRALGGPWDLAAQVEDIAVPTLTDYVWNETAKGVTHLVVSDRNLQMYGDVATVCGAVTNELSTLPSFGFCPLCIDKADLA